MMRLSGKRGEKGESVVLDSRSFLRECLAYLRSQRQDPTRLDGILLLSGEAKFSLSRQVTTALNTLAFAYGIKIAGIRASFLDEASMLQGLRALHRVSPGVPTLPWYAGAPHITKPKKRQWHEKV
ncbi:MAG: hypothetical protein AAB444_01485 [Patescibacteria group bacterium]